MAISESLNEEIPPSFASRKSTFKDRLQAEVGDIFHFFRPLNREIEERTTLLIPMKNSLLQVSNDFYEEPDLKIPSYDPPGNDYRNILHVALTIRKELQSSPALSGINVSNEEVASIIPDSLNLFLKVLINGREIIDECVESVEGNEDKDKDWDEDGDGYEDEDVDEDMSEDGDEGESESSAQQSEDTNTLKTKSDKSQVCLSIAQDIVYAVGKKRKLTPKHIGLGLALHQCTRSRKLVTLFHKAGHCVSYEQVMKIDTTLANLTLKSLDKETGAVTPLNFKKFENANDDPVLHIAADNVDILTDTLDGKVTFHATQMV